MVQVHYMYLWKSHSLQQPSLIIPLCALCPAGIRQQPFAHIYYNPLCLQTEEEDSLFLAESKQNFLFLLCFDKVAGLTRATNWRLVWLANFVFLV